jgi:hypothetical protein
MRKASRFKTEARWTVAIHYGLLAAGLLVLTLALALSWLRAGD